ncbi:arylsulfatase [Thalassoglobus sp. JC818]|uniref:arylsulfatase n=1 Tax=Thalassoglobus sp. JC818 TaxID=3232136 RepID=UPI003459E84E
MSESHWRQLCIASLCVLKLLFCDSLTTSTTQADSSTNSHPNVVVILTDDQGWGDLSLNGNTNLKTPNIDSLAADGAKFDRFYVCPVCSPTRAEFLTGRYHPRSGVYSTSAGGERMNLDEKTIADVFQEAGYHTAAYGKWHNGMQYPYHPNGRGFDEFYGFCSGHWGHYFDWMLERNGELVQGNGFTVDDFTTQAMNFIDEHQDEPFFIYLPYNTPHSPMQVPQKYWDRHRDQELEMRSDNPEKEDIGHTRAALAMCENIDDNVGRLLAKLDERDLADNTIFIYFCDNGPNGNRWNGGMKGRKGSTDEGGVRSPCLVRWPAKIPAGEMITEIGGAIDLLPTLADMCGIDLQDHPAALDGISLSPLLTGEETSWPDRTIFSHWRNRVSARTQRFRLDHEGQLFDMQSDPGQKKNVVADHPEIAKELKAQVKQWKKTVLEGYDQDDRPFLVGHPDFIATQIPARDGVAHGKIQRSNRFPNCSYFTNWVSTDDTIQWDVEVVEDGAFEVDLYYTCKADDVGCVMELSCGDSSIAACIETPNDPPLVGAEEDRVERQESYVKDFHPVSIGTISLKKGAGQLVLKALEIPGDEAIEFRLLMLKRVD